MGVSHPPDPPQALLLRLFENGGCCPRRRTGRAGSRIERQRLKGGIRLHPSLQRLDNRHQLQGVGEENTHDKYYLYDRYERAPFLHPDDETTKRAHNKRNKAKRVKTYS